MSNLGRASIRLRTTSSTRRRRRSWRRSSSLGGRRGKVSFRSKNKSENIFPIKNHSDWVANGSEEDEKNTQEAKEAGSGGEEGKSTTFAIFHYLLLLPVPFISASVAATFQWLSSRCGAIRSWINRTREERVARMWKRFYDSNLRFN